jgi:hypothetical protein
MGRGRAKAKQTKVARKLKYSGGGTDLDRLRRELGVSEEPAVPAGHISVPEDAAESERDHDREPGA